MSGESVGGWVEAGPPSPPSPASLPLCISAASAASAARAAERARLIAGRSKPIRIPMTEITTSNSTSVNPFLQTPLGIVGLHPVPGRMCFDSL